MSKYWVDRERKHMKTKEKDVMKLARNLKANQNEVMSNIDAQINEFYGKYADREGISIEEARKRATKADISKYETKAKKYVKDSKSKDESVRMQSFTKSANDEMRLYNMTMRVNRLELLKANIHLDLLSMRSYEERKMYDYLLHTATGEFERQAGTLGKSIGANAKKMASIVNSSFLTSTWSDRLWNNQEALRMELNTLLNNNITMGRGARHQARELRKVFDVSIANSERLLITETARVQTDVFIDSMKQGGFEKYEYIAEATACDICSDLDGEIFKLNDAAIGKNMAPMHPNCMCGMANVYSEDD